MAINTVLLDIEGTTTPISFVYDVYPIVHAFDELLLDCPTSQQT